MTTTKDIASIKSLLQQDPILANIIQQIPFPQIGSTQNVFHDLLSCVLEQQIHYRSTKKQFERLLQEAGLKEVTPENFEILEEKALVHFKMSNRKVETLEALLHFFEQGSPDWQKMTDEEVIQTLTSIKGIGLWTAEMILIYTLNRPNIFPLNDFHLKQILIQRFEVNSAHFSREAQQISEAWKPYRSYAVLYLLDWKAQTSRP